MLHMVDKYLSLKSYISVTSLGELTCMFLMDGTICHLSHISHYLLFHE